MSTTSSSLLPRVLGWVLKIAVPILLLWLLLNFVWAPSCGRFGCSYEPYWLPQAAADSGGCPDTYKAAWDDATWAADRYDTIKNKHVTTGVFYDEDGEPETFESGDEKGTDAARARKILSNVGAATAPDGSYPAASHVEIKVAALMRETGLSTGLLIINRENGPCAGDVGLSCQEVLPQVLPSGSTLRVWFPKAGAMDHQDFQGK